MASSPTSQPTLVDPRGPRFAAALTSAVLAVVLVTGDSWVLLAQTVVFALGVAGRSPYAWAYRRAVRPRLGPPAQLEDARPLRFAQAVGLGFAVVALLGAAAGLPALSLGATGAAFGAAFLNAAFGICLGCETYLLLLRARGRATTRTAALATTDHPRTEVQYEHS